MSEKIRSRISRLYATWLDKAGPTSATISREKLLVRLWGDEKLVPRDEHEAEITRLRAELSELATAAAEHDAAIKNRCCWFCGRKPSDKPAGVLGVQND